MTLELSGLARLPGNEKACVAGREDAIAEGAIELDAPAHGRRGFPDQPAALAPFDRQVGGVRDPHAARTTEAGPVLARASDGQTSIAKDITEYATHRT